MGHIGEQAQHLGFGFEMTLGVARKKAAGIPNGNLFPNAGEDVDELPLLRTSMPGAVGRQERDLEPGGDFHYVLVAGFLLAGSMALQFGVGMLPAEQQKRFFQFGSVLRSREAHES